MLLSLLYWIVSVKLLVDNLSLLSISKLFLSESFLIFPFFKYFLTMFLFSCNSLSKLRPLIVVGFGRRIYPPLEFDILFIFIFITLFLNIMADEVS